MSYRWDYRNKPFLCRIWMLIIITSISCMDISGCDSPMFFQSIGDRHNEPKSERRIKTVKETIGVGVNEKAALSSDKNCPFVYINFDFTLVNKVASL